MSILLWRNGMCFAKGADYKASGHGAEISLEFPPYAKF
jgi:hypothetical protein